MKRIIKFNQRGGGLWFAGGNKDQIFSFIPFPWDSLKVTPISRNKFEAPRISVRHKFCSPEKIHFLWGPLQKQLYLMMRIPIISKNDLMYGFLLFIFLIF